MELRIIVTVSSYSIASRLTDCANLTDKTINSTVQLYCLWPLTYYLPQAMITPVIGGVTPLAHALQDATVPPREYWPAPGHLMRDDPWR